MTALGAGTFPPGYSIKVDGNDRLGMTGAVTSLACEVHCALLPLMVTQLSRDGLGFLSDERLEWALVGTSALLGVTSLCLGYREHRSRYARAILAIGLALLADPIGIISVVAGGVSAACPISSIGRCAMHAASADRVTGSSTNRS